MEKFYKLIEMQLTKWEKSSWHNGRNKVDKNERYKVAKNERNTQWWGWDIYLALIYWQELSHATAKLMSLFRGWRKKLSSTIDRFSVNLSARPYNRHKPTPECVLEICDKTCKEQLYQPLAVHLCPYLSGFLNIYDWNFAFKKFE